MSTHRTSCPLDCPDLCAIEAHVEDGRLVRLDGNPAHPVTAGFICGKVRRFGEHVYCAERLQTPARRIGPKGAGQFTPITWDEALDTIVTRWQQIGAESGGEAILPFCYGGSNGRFTHDALDARLFRRLGASLLARTVCAAPTSRVSSALYGKMPGVAFTDYAAAQLIILWGVNPQTSSIHLVPFLRQARERGARLVVVDPRTTGLARQADLHLSVRPGTDVAVALSIIAWLFDTGRADRRFLEAHATGVELLAERAAGWTFARAAETANVPMESLQTLATWYAEAQPAVIRCGWGVERSRNAGSSVAAILALPAVAGKFGVRGGGYTMSNSGAWRLEQEAAIGEPEPSVRTINMNQLGRALLDELDPPIQSLFVYNANPVATIPHQEKVRAGLAREDLFTVVFEQVMTDTALFADILLPATTFLEHHDFRVGYGCAELGRIEPVIDRVGQSRANNEVFGDLIARMGLAKAEDVTAPAPYLERLLGQHPQRATWEKQLEETGRAMAEPHAPVAFVDQFPGTPDGKIHLCPASLDQESPQGLYTYLPSEPKQVAAYPLQLISPATERLVNSTFGQLWRGLVPVEVHPDDVRERGLVDGQHVRLFNDLGEVICPLKVSPDTRRGVVVLPKGLWSHHTVNGRTANALAPDELTDVAGGACFHDSWVQLEAASS